MNVAPCLRHHLQRGLIRHRHPSPSAVWSRRKNVISQTNSSSTQVLQTKHSCPSSPFLASLPESRARHETDVGNRRRLGERLLSSAVAASVIENCDTNDNAFTVGGEQGGGGGGRGAGGAMSQFQPPRPGMKPLDLYQMRLDSGELHIDTQQTSLIQKLDNLHGLLRSYEAHPPTSDSMDSLLTLLGVKPKRQVSASFHDPSVPKGVYIWGSVGCGKTMLMDLFFVTCDHLVKKKRVHFHSFMIGIHKKIHALKQELAPRQYNVSKTDPFDPIPPVAAAIANKYTLICFDEFQVTDIADAMILKRLFGELWKHGVVIVATSNRHPKNLYQNGLQRSNFVPFIGLLTSHCDIMHLDSTVDYRVQAGISAGDTYFVESKSNVDAEMDKAFRELAAKQYDTVIKPATLRVMSRTLVFPKTCGTLLDTDFETLCRQPLGAADYLAIAKEFDVVFIRGIPRMTMKDKSSARRFITLIDTFYDAKVRVICSAEDYPEKLFTSHGDSSLKEASAMRILQDDLAIGDKSDDKSLLAGEVEWLAWKRTRSRMMEMQSASYWRTGLLREKT